MQDNSLIREAIKLNKTLFGRCCLFSQTQLCLLCVSVYSSQAPRLRLFTKGLPGRRRMSRIPCTCAAGFHLKCVQPCASPCIQRWTHPTTPGPLGVYRRGRGFSLSPVHICSLSPTHPHSTLDSHREATSRLVSRSSAPEPGFGPDHRLGEPHCRVCPHSVLSAGDCFRCPLSAGS